MVGQQSHDLLPVGEQRSVDECVIPHIVLHGQAADSRCGLRLLAFDLLVGVFLSSHGGSFHHVLLLNDL